MKTKRFNLSAIMTEAWNMFKCTFFHYSTFADALKRAWYNAKQKLAAEEARAKRMAETQRMAGEAKQAPKSKRDEFYEKFDKQIACDYRNVTMGKNDWVVDYARNRYGRSRYARNYRYAH